MLKRLNYKTSTKCVCIYTIRLRYIVLYNFKHFYTVLDKLAKCKNSKQYKEKF